MERPTRKRGEGPAAPAGNHIPRGAAVAVYASGTREASARLAPAHDWPDWTDQVRYTITRSWPQARPGGDA